MNFDISFQSPPIHEEHHHTQNYFYAPIISSHKKKVFHKRPVILTPPSSTYSSSPPPFILENNRNRNSNYLDFINHDQATRSSSTESSTSSTSTLRHVDTFPSTPVVIPTKFFYRRRQVSFKNVYIICVCVSRLALYIRSFSLPGFFYMCLSSKLFLFFFS